MANVNPWEKQPNESRQAFDAFRIYRDLGPTRSLPRVASECTKSVSLLRRWSSTWNWRERSEEWDAEQDRRRLDARLRNIDDAEERHTKIWKVVQAKALQALEKMDPSDMSISQILAYLGEGTRGERLSLGEPGDIEERREKVDVVNQDDIDAAAERYAPVLAKIIQRGALAKVAGEEQPANGNGNGHH